MTNSITRIPLTLDMLPDTGNPRYKKRIKECERCCSLFIPRSPRTRFCDDCREIHEKEKNKERYIKNGKKQTSAHRWIRKGDKKVYVPVGSYNQSGENNNYYKNGTGIDWFKRALKILPEKCNRCGKTELELKRLTNSKIRCLLLHHRDGNHNNNSEDNWEILCKRCHQNHHSVRGVDGRFMSNKG